MSADHSTTASLQRRLEVATKKLEDLAPSLGYAKTIKAYDKDRRKQLLATCVVKAYENGATSAVEAEFRAFASVAYRAGLNELKDALEASEKTIAEWEAENAAWDSCRSLLAVQRESMRNLEG